MNAYLQIEKYRRIIIVVLLRCLLSGIEPCGVFKMDIYA